MGILFLVELAAIGYARREWILDHLEDASNVDDLSANQDASRDPWIDLQYRIAASDSKYNRTLQVPTIENFEPLLRDPKSGLEEFYVVGTGPKPTRGVSGELEVRDPSRKVKGLSHGGLVMVLVPGGYCPMGSADDDGHAWSDERPQHDVLISSFYLAKTEFTNLQRSAVEGMTPDADTLEFPVTDIDWEESKALCDKLGLRLPSESEWEHACRARTTTRYFFGDDETHAKDYAWYFLNSGSMELPLETELDTLKFAYWKLSTHPVATRLPSMFGLFDMSGNVFEWCEDDWHQSYSDSSIKFEGLLGSMNSVDTHVLAPRYKIAWVDSPRSLFRVIRGGSFREGTDRLRSAFRWGDDAGLRDDAVGFRPARQLAP